MSADPELKPEAGVQTDFSPESRVKQETPETSQIKEEPEEQRLKQEEEQLPEFKVPGSRNKWCITCLSETGVSCRTCPQSGNVQLQNKHPMDSTRDLFKAKEDCQARNKKQSSSEKEHDQALKLLERFSCLGYFPVLLLAKEHNGDVRAEIKLSLDFQLPKTLKSRLKEAFEEIVHIYRKISLPGNLDEADSPQLHENSPATQSTSGSVQTDTFSPESRVKQEIPETPQIKDEPGEKSSKTPNIIISDVFSLCDGNETKHRCGAESRDPVGEGRTSGIGGRDKKHECSVCKKRYKTKFNLEMHSRNHTGERPYSCTVCKKTFTLKHILNTHMISHTGERPYSCSVCKKTFAQKRILNTHMAIHTGERPYSCSVCEKAFPQRHHMKIHMRCHTGERPYSCSFCEKSFIQKQQYTTHMRCHTGEKPYSCAICMKTFAQKGALNTHMRTHTGEKPFSCSVCKETFAQKTSLNNHMSKHRLSNVTNSTGTFSTSSAEEPCQEPAAQKW